MYFNHAFRRTLLGKNNSGALLNNLAIGSTTYSSATFSATTGATYTMSAAHGFSVGDTVIITGHTSTAVPHNGTWVILSVPTTSTFIVGDYSTGAASGSPVVLGYKSTTTLSSGQLGLFDRNFKPVAVTATAASDPFYIVQGSYFKNTGYSDKIGSHGGYQESVKSKMINPKYISRIFWVQAKAPVQQVVKIPVTGGLNADTTYRLRIDVKGSPALRFLSHNIYRVMDTYTGPLNATNPTFQKDPIATLVDWKEQLTMSPYFNQLVQARVFVYKASITGDGTAPTFPTSGNAGYLSRVTITTASTTDVYVGQRAVATGLPANSYVTAVTSGTSIVVSYPTQTSNPTLTTGLTVRLFNDVYGSNGGYTTPYTNIAVTSGQQPTYVGQPTYIPGSSDYTTGPAQTSGTATGATIAVASTVSSASSGAHIYTPVSDALSFSYTANQEPFMELTAAYLETKFGNPTFTVTDNYDLEPLKIIASLMDDSGSTTVTAPIGTAAAQTITDAGIATQVQAVSQAQGTGETVLRELILTGRYRQEAFGDGTNIDQFRMREIEANPGVLDMMTVAKRNGLYNKLCILHSVPRFNNPTGVFDNDQYLIEIAVPNTVSISQFFSAATYSAGGQITAAGTGLGDYILETSIAAGGVQYAEMI